MLPLALSLPAYKDLSMTGITIQAEEAGRPYDQFILFGDSITEMSFNQDLGFAFGAGLQEGTF